MKIYRPIQSNTKTQAFGEDVPCVIKGKRPFQFVPCGTPNSHKLYTGALGMKGHSGEDWTTSYKEPVYFPVKIDGIQWEADTHTDSSGAIICVVRSTMPVAFDTCPTHVSGSLKQIQRQFDALRGLYLQFWFVHLESSVCFNRKKVTTGDLLGYADSTGASSGNHLHWCMKVSDPNSWWFIDGDNGYNGAIDFSPWFTNEYVKGTTPPPAPIFTQKMYYKERSANVLKLQQHLTKLGYFNETPTSYYGRVTANAVLTFQLDKQVDNPQTLKNLKGEVVGNKTLLALNKLV